MTREEHKRLGIELFNATWDLMDRKQRTRTEDFEMMDVAHASGYHWRAGGGDATNEARSQWQISRVYAILKMGEAALVHGRRSLDLCLESAIGGFDLAFGYEAVARAHAILGNGDEKEEYRAKGIAACAQIAGAEDKAYCEGELTGIV